MRVQHRSFWRMAVATFVALLLPGFCTNAQSGNPSRGASGFVSHEGGRLHYEAAGEGCAVVLIAGGGGMDSRQWDDQFAFLRSRARVIRFEPRGSGKSDAAQASYSNAEDLKAVLDFLDVRRAVFAGVSSGGAIALEFALTYPERIQGLVLAAPLVPGFEMSEALRQRVAGFTKAASSGVEPGIKAFLDDRHFIPAPRNPQARVRAAMLMRENARDTAPGVARQLDPPTVRRLGEIKAPTLLLIGKLDHPDLHRRVEFVHKAIAGSSRVALPAAGHMSNMENPAAFNRAVNNFIRGIGCGPRAGR